MNENLLAPNPTQTESEETAIKLNIDGRGIFATWLFIIACFFYFYNYSENEKSLLTEDKEQSSLHESNSIKAIEIGSIILLIGMVIFFINSIEQLKLLLVDANENNTVNPTLIQGQRIVTFSNLIKVIGFAGAAIGYQVIGQSQDGT